MAPVHTLFTGARAPGLYRLRSGVSDRSIEQAAQAHGWHIARVDGCASSDRRSFIEAMGRALHFPAYSATNWDAFEESLRDLGWLPQPGAVVICEAAACLPDDVATMARDILAAAAESSPARDKTLVVLFRHAGRTLPGVPWL